MDDVIFHVPKNVIIFHSDAKAAAAAANAAAALATEKAAQAAAKAALAAEKAAEANSAAENAQTVMDAAKGNYESLDDRLDAIEEGALLDYVPETDPTTLLD